MGSASSDEYPERGDPSPEQARREGRASSRRARRSRRGGRQARRHLRVEGSSSAEAEEEAAEVKAGPAPFSDGEFDGDRRISWAHEAGRRVTAVWGGARRAMTRPFRPGRDGGDDDAGRSEGEGGGVARSGSPPTGRTPATVGPESNGRAAEADQRLAAMGQWATPNERRSYRRRLQQRRRGDALARRKRTLAQGRGRSARGGGGAGGKRRARQGSMSKLRRGLLSDPDCPIADHRAVATVLEQHGRSDTQGSLGGYLAEGEGPGPRTAGAPECVCPPPPAFSHSLHRPRLLRY